MTSDPEPSNANSLYDECKSVSDIRLLDNTHVCSISVYLCLPGLFLQRILLLKFNVCIEVRHMTLCRTECMFVSQVSFCREFFTKLSCLCLNVMCVLTSNRDMTLLLKWNVCIEVRHMALCRKECSRFVFKDLRHVSDIRDIFDATHASSVYL